MAVLEEVNKTKTRTPRPAILSNSAPKRQWILYSSNALGCYMLRPRWQGQRPQNHTSGYASSSIPRPRSWSSILTATNGAQKDESRTYSSNAAKPSRPTRIFSGIQPTGVPHLGNYLGAILPWVQLQNNASPDTTLIFSIVDLHSLTSSSSSTDRLRSRRQLLAAFIAAGLDTERCIIFNQSAVPQHAELHWILSCTASMSTLARMTQWKTKMAEEEGQDLKASLASAEELMFQSANPKNAERLKLGLFSYPVLQAADILIHGATHVPVGEDQRQHVEFARTCAGNFNHAFGSSEVGVPGKEILRQPEVVVSEAKRVMSLTQPERKMSKSHPSDKSRILLTDTDEQIRKKLKTALTDSLDGISYDREARPGVSNLLEIIAHLEHRSVGDIVEDMRSCSLKDLKMRAAELVIKAFRPMREKYESLVGEADGQKLDIVAGEGAEKARQSANQTMQHVREAVGI